MTPPFQQDAVPQHRVYVIFHPVSFGYSYRVRRTPPLSAISSYPSAPVVIVVHGRIDQTICSSGVCMDSLLDTVYSIVIDTLTDGTVYRDIIAPLLHPTILPHCPSLIPPPPTQPLPSFEWRYHTLNFIFHY